MPAGQDPIRELERWIEEARAEGIPQPASVAFVTVGDSGRPSARTVTLKRIEEDALLFTSALWTRKAEEIEANPQVALLFHWPALGRQVHVTGRRHPGRARPGRGALRRARPRAPAADRRLPPGRADRRPRSRSATASPTSPRSRRPRPPAPRTGAPCACDREAIELWSEAADRLHERRLFERERGRLEAHAAGALATVVRAPSRLHQRRGGGPFDPTINDRAKLPGRQPTSAKSKLPSARARAPTAPADHAPRVPPCLRVAAERRRG